MKYLKKCMAICLTTIFCVLLAAGCGSGKKENSAGGDNYPEDIQKIVDRGVLKVGVKNSVVGFGYQDILTGEYSGLEVDLGKKIADYLGVDVEYTTVTAATRGELIDSGDLDCVLATFTITDARKEIWDFTDSYYTDHVSVLVEQSTGITSLEDLLGSTVGVSSGSTSAKMLVEAMIENGYISGENFDEETFDPATWTEGLTFQQYDDYPTISIALSSNEVQGFCVDKSILGIYHTDTRTYIKDEFAPQDYGIVTRKGSDFSELCEELVLQWKADGTLDELAKQYDLD